MELLRSDCQTDSQLLISQDRTEKRIRKNALTWNFMPAKLSSEIEGQIIGLSNIFFGSVPQSKQK